MSSTVRYTRGDHARATARKARAAGIVSMTIAIACGFAPTLARAEDKADVRRGMSYSSIARLPDFSGWWYLDLDPNAGFQSLSVVFAAYAPLLKPELAKQFANFAAQATAG